LLASYPINDDQAVAEISDTLGLGIKLYINRKKVDMFQDPSAYLLQRNKELIDAGANSEDFMQPLLKMQ